MLNGGFRANVVNTRKIATSRKSHPRSEPPIALPSPAWMRAANWRPSIDVATLATVVASVIPRIFFIQGVRIRTLAALTIEAGIKIPPEHSDLKRANGWAHKPRTIYQKKGENHENQH